jgi:hypothetical protein
LAVAQGGGNLLTEARARELRRLERLVVSSLRDAAPAALEVEVQLELSITRSLFLGNGSLAPCGGGARGDACVQQLMSSRYAERPLTGEEVLLMLQAAQGLQAEQVLDQLARADLQLEQLEQLQARANTANLTGVLGAQLPRLDASLAAATFREGGEGYAAG